MVEIKEKTSSRVLVVEDDSDITALVTSELQDLGLEVDAATDGVSGLEKGTSGAYALIVLDLTLPKLGGLEVCRRIREQDKNVPILILTSRSSEADIVLGLELGADDYQLKPFRSRELRARMNALLRRRREHDQTGEQTTGSDQFAALGTITVGELRLNLDTRTLYVRETETDIAPLEYELLVFLMRNLERVFTRDQLLDEVWGYGVAGYEATVNSHVSRLRQKIELDPANPQYLVTRRGAGYLFTDATK